MVPSVRRDNRIASAAERRSPRTRVRSLASIATSDPGAHRQAQVGRGEGGGVVDAVADHRHHPPLGLQIGDDAHLVLGQDLGDDVAAIPTSAATACAAPGWSPVSSTGSRPRARSGHDGVCAGRLDGVGDADQAARPPVPRHGHRGRAVGAPGGGLRRQVRRERRTPTRSASHSGRPTATACPSTTPVTPSPVGSRSPRPPASGRGRGGGDRLGDRVLAGVLDRPGQREHLDRVLAGRGQASSVSGHPPGGDGAGLVEHDGVDRAGCPRAPRGRGSGCRAARRGRCRRAARSAWPVRGRTGRR